MRFAQKTKFYVNSASLELPPVKVENIKNIEIGKTKRTRMSEFVEFCSFKGKLKLFSVFATLKHPETLYFDYVSSDKRLSEFLRGIGEEPIISICKGEKLFRNTRAKKMGFLHFLEKYE